MKQVIFGAALLVACAVHADTFTNCGVHVHVAAYHNEPGYNSATPGLGVICDTRYENWRAGAGVFRNSVDRTSVYVGATWQPLHFGRVKAGLFGGVITGYRSHIMPMAAGLVSVHLDYKTSAHFTLLPSVKGLTPMTVALSVERRF